MPPPITITIDHRVAEHVLADRLYYKATSRLVTVDRAVSVLLLLFGIYAVATAGLRWWTVIWFLLAPLEFFNLLSLDSGMVRYRFRNTPKFAQQMELTFTEESIHLKTPAIESDVKWEMYSNLVENEDLILLIYGKRMYTVIPKRCFSGAEDLNSFRALATKSLPCLRRGNKGLP